MTETQFQPTRYTVRTGAGALVRMFDTRRQAIDWLDANAHLFPGWRLYAETMRTTIDRRVLRRDRQTQETA
jgi:hypothetical protein